MIDGPHGIVLTYHICFKQEIKKTGCPKGELHEIVKSLGNASVKIQVIH